MKFRSLMVGAVFAAATLVSIQAKADLVINGGFEDGFAGWITGANSFPQTIVTDPFHGGTHSAQIAGFAIDPNTLTQIFATTTAGQSYTLSFWRLQARGTPPISLIVTWDDVTVFSESNTGATGWQNFQASVVGTGLDKLVFTSVNDDAFTYLDDVSLNVTAAVPEPATWAMMILGFAGIGFAAYRRKPLRLA